MDAIEVYILLGSYFCINWILQIVGLCQALNDVLDSMAKKGLSIPVWSDDNEADRFAAQINWLQFCMLYSLSIGFSCHPGSEIIQHRTIMA